MRSAVYGGGELILTVISNAERAVWPLYRRLEEVLEL